jgi:hypothetical protein
MTMQKFNGFVGDFMNFEVYCTEMCAIVIEDLKSYSSAQNCFTGCEYQVLIFVNLFMIFRYAISQSLEGSGYLLLFLVSQDDHQIFENDDEVNEQIDRVPEKTILITNTSLSFIPVSGN